MTLGALFAVFLLGLLALAYEAVERREHWITKTALYVLLGAIMLIYLGT